MAPTQSLMSIPAVFPKAIEVWNGWEIRALVLLSLSLQIILIVFGRRRKYYSGFLLSSVIWLFYVSAEIVATFTLSNLAKKESNSISNIKSHYSPIQAFWSPFLLLHLGGPDTITSYSLEDNNLWLRHFLGLVVEVIIALYAYFSSWTASTLTFAAVPVFIAGFIKYGERTWTLYSSTSKKIKKLLISQAALPSKRSPPPPSANYLRRAFYLFKMSLYIFSDLILGFSELRDSYLIITSVNSPKEAFELVEVELGLIYDRLYTKAAIINSKRGLFLRSISFFSMVIALVLFLNVIRDHPPPPYHRFPLIDIVITYILLIGGLCLEVYAFINVIISDRTLIWLGEKYHENHWIYHFIFFLHYFNKGKRWSGQIAQYNLISSCLEAEKRRVKLLSCICTWLSRISDSDVTRKDVDGVTDLKESIFRHLRKKGRQILNFINTNPEYFSSDGKEVPVMSGDSDAVSIGEEEEPEEECAPLLSSFSVFQKQVDKELRSSLLSLQRNSLIQRSGRSCQFEETVSLSHNIIIWHIATDLCYYNDLENPDRNPGNPNYEMSKALSDYMLYLLVKKSKMLPRGDRGSTGAYRETKEVVQNFLKDRFEATWYSCKVNEVCMDLLRENPLVGRRKEDRKKNKSLVKVAWKLAKELLQRKDFEERWNAISEVWREMVIYAANHYEWRYHEQQLTRGGEFLTHVCLLMTHLGLSEQYQEFDFQMFDDMHLP